MTDSDYEKIDGKLSPWGLLPWGVMIAGSASDVWHGRVPWPAGFLVAAFVLTYAGSLWFGLRDRPHRWRGRISLAAMVLLTLPMIVVFGTNNGYTVLAMLSIALGSALPWRQSYACIFALAIVAVTVSFIRTPGDSLALGYTTLISGAIVTTIRRFLTAIAELRAAREELAQVAVEKERLRFARDLHDLLGQTLSLIVIKAELAGRLGRDDPRGEQQVADIEQIGRDALREVREAVSGYRESGLAEELARCGRALRDAGIEPVVVQEGDNLPPAAAALFTWAVRESVTNVIRHSGATTCEITVRADERAATLTVADDGRGSSGTAGNGLKGLAERVDLANGTLRTCRNASLPAPDASNEALRGFVVEVEVPIGEEVGKGWLSGKIAALRRVAT
ncbi:sensor histidine kinase [Fodinicola acaciae]|uniref:sensor histidine kinase n=1 Tax=Fodinicola acaciae TaxID=2681555 RepID=UPI0013D0B116|nr:sensor histidine kinase [Fodinicola acaciae]